MGEILQFEDLKTKIQTSKTKDKIELEKQMIKLAKEFIDCVSDLVLLGKNIKEGYQVFNTVFENQVRIKRFIEESGLSSDLSIRTTYNAVVDRE